MLKCRTALALDSKRLEVARVVLGLTKIEIAKAAHLSGSATYRALGGGRCGVKVARAIAQVLNLQLTDLWIDVCTGRPLGAIE